MSDVFLNTEHRQNPTLSNPNDCIVPVRIGQNFSSRPAPGGYTVQLMDVKVKYSWYGVDETNNTIVGTNVGIFQTTIPIGIYTGATLATAIQTVLNAATSGWTVTYNQNLQTFTYSNSAAPFTFNTTSPNFTAWEAMGLPFAPDQTSTGSGPWILEPTNVIDTNHIDYAYVYVDWPGIQSVVSAAKDESNNNIVGGKVPVVCEVSTPDVWGRYCSVNLLGQSYWHSSIIPNQVTMRLYDHDWNLVDTKGQNWRVHFKVYDLPGQAKSLNHVTDVRHDDQILSNAARDDSGISINAPMDPRRGTKRAWEQPRAAAPALENPSQRQRRNVLGFPNAMTFGQ